ncbi:MAG TPA: sulfatase [Thermoanaerobaculia bacterium]|nr:sulfatase [Thermoanaerobaculia bacterium]
MLARIRLYVLLALLPGLACRGFGEERTLSLLPPTSSGCVEAAVRLPVAARLRLAWQPAEPGIAPHPAALEVWSHRAGEPGELLRTIPFSTGSRELSVTVDLGAPPGEVRMLRVSPNSPVTWKRADLVGRTRGGEPPAWRVEPRRGAPNVLVYLIDTLRPDVLGSYGGPGPTPTLDRLAGGGVLFERAYSTSSWTRPAVASLFSGLPVSAHQVGSEAFSLPESALTLAERFRLLGYQTAGVIANGHVLPSLHFDQGFETYDWPPFPDQVGSTWEPAAVTANPAAGEVHRLALRRLTESRDRRRPLFLYVHVVDPHQPYRPPEWVLGEKRPAENVNNFLLRSINEGEEGSPQLLADLALAYRGAVAYADRELGRFLAQLGTLVDLDQTVILVVSDHGEAFFEHRFVGHRNWLYEELTRVPMILRGPGIPAGRREVAPVSLLDVVPTLLALAEPGSRPAGRVPGVNLLAPGAGSRLAGRAVPSEFGTGAALVRGEWKLTYHGEDPEGLRFRLYDLREDPAEDDDRFGREPEVARQLQAALRAWQATARRLALPALPVEVARLGSGLRENLRALGYVK